MPNYNYRSNDYARRSQYPHQTPAAATTARAEQEYNGLVIAMAYVPWQEFRNVYSAEKALCRGTIFEELDKPFLGKGGCCK